MPLETVGFARNAKKSNGRKDILKMKNTSKATKIIAFVLLGAMVVSAIAILAIALS